MAWCYSSLQLDSLEAASLTLLLTYTMNSLFWGEDDSQRVSPFPSFPDCLYLQCDLYVGTLSVGACVQLDCVHYRKLDYEDESSVAYPS